MADIKEILARATAEDLRIDRFGRVVIGNRELEEAIKGSVALRSTGDEIAGNGICCGNTSCASPELMDLMQRLVGGARA